MHLVQTEWSAIAYLRNVVPDSGQVPNGRCGECSKIEGPLLVGRRCHSKSGQSCSTNGSDGTSDGSAEGLHTEFSIKERLKRTRFQIPRKRKTVFRLPAVCLVLVKI